jgi:hypothetical protein
MDYITCNSKRNRPRVNVAVCARCKRRGICPDYVNYLQFPLFPDLFHDNMLTEGTFGRLRKQTRLKQDDAPSANRGEQLVFSL